LPIPKVVPAFDSLALYPAKKLVAVLDDLQTNVAPRLGLSTTTDHIRISIVRDARMEDQFHTATELVRDTPQGPLDTLITYHRPLTRRVPDFNDGKVMVHPGAGERERWRKIMDDYFFGGLQLSVAQLREALRTGKFPDEQPNIVGYADHLNLG
jgi:hypothetical protein